jgi:hypothetical protein
MYLFLHDADIALVVVLQNVAIQNESLSFKPTKLKKDICFKFKRLHNLNEDEISLVERKQQHFSS